MYAATDKCGTESECLSFVQHMRAADEAWVGQSPATNIVVTTESRQILREQREWAQNSSLHFLLNSNDVAQNTGYVMSMDGNVTADDAMVSALSSLKAQLRTGFTLGNCCSNFHLLLKDLLNVGCGASTENTFQCLQDHKNDRYRICCAWDKSARCLSRRSGTWLNGTAP